jgi:hypothetical protein
MTLFSIFLGRAILAVLLWIPASSSVVLSNQIDYCRIFGSVYVEEKPNYADYHVYVEESEAFADIIVFKADNRLFADKEGLWHFTDKKAFADFTVYFEKDRGLAEFSICFTDAESFAGCNR